MRPLLKNRQNAGLSVLREVIDMAKYCRQCRHSRKVARAAGKANGLKGKKLEVYVKGIKCLSCGLPQLAGAVLQLRDKDKLKLIRLEMRFK